MNLEEKINELEDRIKVLEKKEKQRKTNKIVKVVVEILLLGVFIYFSYKAYVYIKPYVKQIGDSKELKELINKGKETIQENK